MTAKSESPAPLRWTWLGRAPFEPTVRLQEAVRTQVAAGEAPALLLCEHDPVITLGRSARPENVLAPPSALAAAGVSLHHASRGGDVTYHGPGQLVGYPIMRLQRGVVAHVQAMASAVTEVLATFGIDGTFRRDQPGVWVGAAKICAFGVHVRHRVSIHGFAFNVNPDMRHFGLIVPCGLAGSPVTSLASLMPGDAPAVATIAPLIARAVAAATGHVPFEMPAASIAACTAAALH